MSSVVSTVDSVCVLYRKSSHIHRKFLFYIAYISTNTMFKIGIIRSNVNQSE